MKITIDFPKPLVSITEKVKLVSVGYQHSFAVTDSNKVYSWIPTSQEDPLEVQEVQGIKAGTVITDIKSASFQTVLLTGDKTLVRIDHPQTETPVQTPFKAVPIKRLSNIVKISACYGHALALERADTEPVAQWPP